MRGYLVVVRTALIVVSVIGALAPIPLAAASGPIIEYPLGANNRPLYLVEGPDKNLWFGDSVATSHISYLARMDPGVSLDLFPLPNTIVGGGQIVGVTVGPDKNIWFADYRCAIGRSTLSGNITEYYESPCGGPVAIATGGDGNLWFTDSTNSSIGRITTSGIMTMYPLGHFQALPAGIVEGPDGNMWFAEEGANQIGRITPAGVITEFPLPRPKSFPHGITVGPDSNLWFTERGRVGGGIWYLGKITTAGSISEVTIRNRANEIIQLGGALWFTEIESNAFGSYVPGGRLTKHILPEVNSGPLAIASGPGTDTDKDVWLTEADGGRLAQFVR